MGQLYIVHFSEKFAHARHYTGYVKSDLPRATFIRFKKHLAGKGSRFLNIVNEAGIRFKLVKIITNQTLQDEKKLKKHAARYCPICKAEREAGKQLFIDFNYVFIYEQD
jgi:hypothetical protein